MPSFLHADDYIILMITPGREEPWTVEVLTAMRQAGIRTVIHYVSWRDLERTPGEFNWPYVQAQIDRDRAADVKTLLSVYDIAPPFFEEDYYLRAPNGTRYADHFYANMIAPWGPGWQRHLDFVADFCTRFNADDVLCFRSTCHGGECMFPESRRHFFVPEGVDLKTLAVQVMLQEQTLFRQTTSYPDLFTQLHHAFDAHPLACTSEIPTIYAALREKFPDMVQHNICYTYFGPVGGKPDHVADIARYGYRAFCGSEYADGLIANTDEAIQLGFSGFVTAPLHPYNGRKAVRGWMYDAVSQSVAKWQAADKRDKPWSKI